MCGIQCVLLVYYAASSGNSLPTFLPCRRFGTTSGPETSVMNYHSSLRNAPEERSSHLLRSGSLKSHKETLVLKNDVTLCC